MQTGGTIGAPLCASCPWFFGMDTWVSFPLFWRQDGGCSYLSWPFSALLNNFACDTRLCSLVDFGFLPRSCVHWASSVPLSPVYAIQQRDRKALTSGGRSAWQKFSHSRAHSERTSKEQQHPLSYKGGSSGHETQSSCNRHPVKSRKHTAFQSLLKREARPLVCRSRSPDHC